MVYILQRKFLHSELMLIFKIKQMKFLKYICIASVFLFFSCDPDKNLNLAPENRLTEGSFYTTANQLVSATNDVYRQLGLLYDAQTIVDQYGELQSDNAYIFRSSGGSGAYNFIPSFELRSDLMNWDVYYNSIYICNNIIEILKSTSVSIDESLKMRMIAEATLVRSIIYFNMVRVWGSVPLVLEKITVDEAYDHLRESPEVIYNQIISDLNFAINTLPASYTGGDVGRLTRYAAAAVLAKVYLTLDKAADAQKELEFIINSNQFSLDANDDGTINMDDFRHLFHADTKNSKESVLEIQYMAGVNGFNSNHQHAYTPFHAAFHLPGYTLTRRGEGRLTPTMDLISEFEEGDPRLQETIEMGFEELATGEFVEYPYTKKFNDPNIEYSGQNFEVIRYADILLMYAEVTGNETYLNMVRQRAGLPLYGTDEYPSDLYYTFALAIEHERRVELAFEFHRFFDLVRTGRAIEVMQSKGFEKISSDRLLWPIPQNAIDVNPRLTQNPGY